MAVILPFLPDLRRRARPVGQGQKRGEIVFFSGVRVDRQPAANGGEPPVPTRRPQPGRRR